MAAPGPPPNYAEPPPPNLGTGQAALHITQTSSNGNNGILFVAGNSSSPTMDFRSSNSTSAMMDVEEKKLSANSSTTVFAPIGSDPIRPLPSGATLSSGTGSLSNESKLTESKQDVLLGGSFVKSFANVHANSTGNPRVVVIDVTDPKYVLQVLHNNNKTAEKSLNFTLAKSLFRQFMLHKFELPETHMFSGRGHNENDAKVKLAMQVKPILSTCAVSYAVNSTKPNAILFIVTCNTSNQADLLSRLFSERNIPVRKDRSSIVVFKVGPFSAQFRSSNDDSSLQAYFHNYGFKGKIKWEDRGATAVCLYSDVGSLINNERLSNIQGKDLVFRKVLSPALRLCSHCQSVNHKVASCPNRSQENTYESHWCRDCSECHAIEHSEFSVLKCKNYIQDETLCRFCVAYGKDPKVAITHRARNCPLIKSRMDTKFVTDFRQRADKTKLPTFLNRLAAPFTSQSNVPPTASNPHSYASVASRPVNSSMGTASEAPLGRPEMQSKTNPFSFSSAAARIIPLSSASSPSTTHPQQLLDVIKDLERDKKLLNEKMEQDRKAMNDRFEQLVKQVESLTKLTETLVMKLSSMDTQWNSQKKAAKATAPHALSHTDSVTHTRNSKKPQTSSHPIPTFNSYRGLSPPDDNEEPINNDDQHNGDDTDDNLILKHDLSALSQSTPGPTPVPGNLVFGGQEYTLTPVKLTKSKRTKHDNHHDDAEQSVSSSYKGTLSQSQTQLESPARGRHTTKTSRMRSPSRSRDTRNNNASRN